MNPQVVSIAGLVIVCFLGVFAWIKAKSSYLKQDGFVTVAQLPKGVPFTVAVHLEKWPGYVIGEFFGNRGIFLLKLPEQCHNFRVGDVLSTYLKEGKPVFKICALSKED